MCKPQSEGTARNSGLFAKHAAEFSIVVRISPQSYRRLVSQTGLDYVRRQNPGIFRVTPKAVWVWPWLPESTEGAVRCAFCVLWSVFLFEFIGCGRRSRTFIFEFKARCVFQLHHPTKFMVAAAGIEPASLGYKPSALPLRYTAIEVGCGGRIRTFVWPH